MATNRKEALQWYVGQIVKIKGVFNNTYTSHTGNRSLVLNEVSFFQKGKKRGELDHLHLLVDSQIYDYIVEDIHIKKGETLICYVVVTRYKSSISQVKFKYGMRELVGGCIYFKDRQKWYTFLTPHLDETWVSEGFWAMLRYHGLKDVATEIIVNNDDLFVAELNNDKIGPLMGTVFIKSNRYNLSIETKKYKVYERCPSACYSKEELGEVI